MGPHGLFRWLPRKSRIGPLCKCTVTFLGLMQGAFFIFHLLTKLFPSRDQPPIHLDHMTNHLTSHLTTHMTSHMPSSHLLLKNVTCPMSPASRSPAYHLILPYLIPHDPRFVLIPLYSFTLALVPASWPAYHFLPHIAPFCNSY